MSKVSMICHCGKEYTTRKVDLERGWGLSCSKSCAAIRRDHSLSPGRPKDGTKIAQTKPTPNSCRPNDVRKYSNKGIYLFYSY